MVEEVLLRAGRGGQGILPCGQEEIQGKTLQGACSSRKVIAQVDGKK